MALQCVIVQLDTLVSSAMNVVVVIMATLQLCLACHVIAMVTLIQVYLDPVTLPQGSVSSVPTMRQGCSVKFVQMVTMAMQPSRTVKVKCFKKSTTTFKKADSSQELHTQ